MKTNLVSALLALALIAYLLFGTRLIHQQWTPVRLAGMTLAAVAFAGLLLSRVQLGRAFAIQARATTLVTSGIYSKVRNPIYLFGGLVFLGLGVAFHSWPLLALLGLTVPLQIARARRESAVLEDRFGERYRAYRRQTWF